MVLPTSMTIFNRSMINLENEIGRLSSFRLNQKVVSKLNSNVKFYNVGKFKTSEVHKSDFYEDYEIDFKINLDSITKRSYYYINVNEGNLEIKVHDKSDEFINLYNFNNLDTYSRENDLPFQLKIYNEFYNQDKISEEKLIIISPFESTVDSYKDKLKISQSSYQNNNQSDQLIIEIEASNIKVGEDYLNTLISEFDLDGINDRQLEYKRTIKFVDQRSVILSKELEQIEISKQKFKEDNNLSDITTDASFQIGQQYTYDSNLFDAQSQRDLLNLLKDETNTAGYKLLPANFGLNSVVINEQVSQFNLIVRERDRFLSTGAGLKNSFILNLESQLDRLSENINKSILNYESKLRYNYK